MLFFGTSRTYMNYMHNRLILLKLFIGHIFESKNSITPSKLFNLVCNAINNIDIFLNVRGTSYLIKSVSLLSVIHVSYEKYNSLSLCVRLFDDNAKFVHSRSSAL